jgi:uncharacterized RDD family membrane protein YckC
VHLTVPDLLVIWVLYVAATASIAFLARTPRNLKNPPQRPNPLGIIVLALAMFALVGALVAVTVDPAAAALLARLLD